jgi:hypothetical protein
MAKSGRRTRLKSGRPKVGREGSSPSPGTTEPPKIIDWTMGVIPNDPDPVMRGMCIGIKAFQTQVNLCHDLMDFSGSGGKDPMAYLAECYRMAAIGMSALKESLRVEMMRQDGA